MKLNEALVKAEVPTSGLVKKYLKLFQNDKHYSNEDKIQRLITRNIYDKDKYETILLTIVVINQLYSTNIYKIYQIADHIYKNREVIHSLISNGDSKAIKEIAIGHGLKSSKRQSDEDINFYSFASKYCNYLNANEFPIYDSYIENMLCIYNKRDSFGNFKREDLRQYSVFKNAIKSFIEHYKLEVFKLRDIDKFLWLYGKELLSDNKVESGVEILNISTKKDKLNDSLPRLNEEELIIANDSTLTKNERSRRLYDKLIIQHPYKDWKFYVKVIAKNTGWDHVNIYDAIKKHINKKL